MSSSIDVTPFQSLLDDAVSKGIAPGFQCVVFNRYSLIYNGVSGMATAPTAESPGSKPLTPQSLLWIASCSKLSLSLIVLHIVERGLAKSGFSIQDLDNAEALCEILPEFKPGSGSFVTKIIEGFDSKLDGDGKKIMKLRDAKGRVTLRMLLTHTAGMAYTWNHPLISELHFPSDGSVPHISNPAATGDIRSFEVPLVSEPNEGWQYGTSADWLGQFAVRSSGKNLRELYKEIIFEPLGIPSAEADIWISPSLREARATMHVREPIHGWKHIDIDLYATEGDPPEGKAHRASGCVISSLQAYAKILQAVINQDPAILSQEVWQMAMKDDLQPRGLKMCRPALSSQSPHVAFSAEEFSKSTARDGAGVNMLQCHVALAPTVSGRPTGSFAWGGLSNTYFFVDPINGVGAIFGTQLLPFFDPDVVEIRDKLEALVYKSLNLNNVV